MFIYTIAFVECYSYQYIVQYGNTGLHLYPPDTAVGILPLLKFLLEN